MSFVILASLILLSVCLKIILKREKLQKENQDKSFWEREREANSVRRKSLDELDYITIPLDTFPTDVLNTDPTVAECIELITGLSTRPIVNLTGYSNTDLKLQYGTANITPLSEYDQNYTLLVCTLQKWADALLAHNYTEEAKILMEFAVSTHTDVSRTYYKLAEIYATRIETKKLRQLVQTASTLRSANRDTIVRTLQESYL